MSKLFRNESQFLRLFFFFSKQLYFIIGERDLPPPLLWMVFVLGQLGKWILSLRSEILRVRWQSDCSGSAERGGLGCSELLLRRKAEPTSQAAGEDQKGSKQRASFLVICWLPFRVFTAMVWVQSLAGKLRSHKQSGWAKKESEKEREKRSRE